MMRHDINKALLCVRVLAHAILLALQYTAEIQETVSNRKNGTKNLLVKAVLRPPDSKTQNKGSCACSCLATLQCTVLNSHVRSLTSLHTLSLFQLS